jgi:hypothetical protein
MLYEILTGNLPTGVPKPASQIMKEIPPALDPIVAKCVEPDPMDRYQSAAELRQALEGVLTMLESASVHGAQPPVRATQRSYAWLRPAIGLTLVLVVFGLTGIGVLGLETRRNAIIEARNSRSPDKAPTAGLDPQERTLGWLLRLLDEAGPRMAALTLSEDMEEVLKRGRELEEAARQNGLPVAEAAWRARHALQCYTAILAPREGMFFVAPGNGQAEGGFYLAERPVSLGAYSSWASQSSWRAVPPPDPGQLASPVVKIQFYDALAYAGAHGLQLPTRAQWERAFQTHANLLASGIFEMTRSTVDGDVSAADLPDFDRPVVVVTAAVQPDEDGVPVRILFGQLPFYRVDEAVGFRCALDAPILPGD